MTAPSSRCVRGPGCAFRATGLATVLMVLTVLTACPGITRPIEKPTVELQQVAVNSIGLSGLDARADFAMTNPNAISLPLSAIDWQLSIGGAFPIRGRVDLSRTIPAKGAAPLAVDLHISAATAVEMIAKLNSGATDYQLSGTLHFQTRRGDIAVVFDYAGALTQLAR